MKRKGRMPLRFRPEMAAYMRDRRRRAADAGRCSICTARPARPPDLETCQVCNDRATTANKRYAVKYQIRKLLGEK